MPIKKATDQSKLNKETQQQRKSLIIFLGIVSTLVVIGVYHHLNSDQSNKSTESFYESRKSPGAYYEYQESEESSKKKAERNIFLQK
jgi:hypothetical protein